MGYPTEERIMLRDARLTKIFRHSRAGGNPVEHTSRRDTL